MNRVQEHAGYHWTEHVWLYPITPQTPVYFIHDSDGTFQAIIMMDHWVPTGQDPGVEADATLFWVKRLRKE